MSKPDIRKHSFGDDDAAPCGVQLGKITATPDDVLAHSADSDDDAAPCGVQLGKVN